MNPHRLLAGDIRMDAEEISATPKITEIGRSYRARSESESEKDQPPKHCDLYKRKNILDLRPQPYATGIDPSEEYQGKNCQQILCVQTGAIRTQHAEPHLIRAKDSRPPDPRRSGDSRKQHAREIRERNRYGGNRRSLDDQQHRPAIQEAPH